LNQNYYIVVYYESRPTIVVSDLTKQNSNRI